MMKGVGTKLKGGSRRLRRYTSKVTLYLGRRCVGWAVEIKELPNSGWSHVEGSMARVLFDKVSKKYGETVAVREFNLEIPFIEAIFCEYWENNNATIQNYAGMTPIVKKLGVNPKEFEKLCESDKIRQSLIDSTNDGIERGVFGVPSIFVGSEMFWGKDRMEFVEDELIKN